MNNLICTICNCRLTGAAPLRQHLSSASHIKKVEIRRAALNGQISQLYCRTCNKTCTSTEQLHQHNESPAHLERQKKASAIANQLGSQAVSAANLNPLGLGDGIQILGASQVTPSSSSSVSGANMYRPNTSLYVNVSPAQGPLHPPAAMNSLPAQLQNRPMNEAYVMRGDRGYCYVCNIELTSAQHCRQHVEGSKHIKKASGFANTVPLMNRDEQNLASTNPFIQNVPLTASNTTNRGPNGVEFDRIGRGGQCFVCNVVFTSEEHAEQHLAGAKHKKKAASSLASLVSGRNTSLAISSAPMVGLVNAPRIESMPPNLPFNSHRSVLEDNQVIQGIAGMSLSGGNESAVMGAVREPTEDKVLMCSLCDVPFSGIRNAEDHFLSEKHKRKKEMLHRQQLDASSSASADKRYDPEQTEVLKCFSSSLSLTRPTDVQVFVASNENARLFNERENYTHQTPVSASPAQPGYVNQTNRMMMNRDDERALQRSAATDNQVGLRQVSDTSPRHAGVEADSGLGQEDPSNSGSESLARASGSQQLSTSASQSSSRHENLSRDSRNFQDVNNGIALEASGNQAAIGCKTNNIDHSNLSSNVDELQKVKNKELGGHALGMLYGQYDSPSFSSSGRSLLEDNFSSIIDNSQQMVGEGPPPPLQPGRSNIDRQTIQPIQEEEHEGLPVGRDEIQPSQLCHLPSQPDTQGNESVPYYFDGSRGYCYCCEIELTSQQHASQHLKGQKHQKKLGQWNLRIAFTTGARGSRPPSQMSPALPGIFPPTYQPPHQPPQQAVPTESYYFHGSRGFCYACNIELTSVQHAQQHINGKPHKRQHERHILSKKGTFYPLSCELCNKSFTGQESAQQHFTSSKHKSKEELSDDAVQTLEKIEEGKIILKDGQTWYVCEVCQVPLNTRDQFEKHRQSPKHKKELENQRARDSGASTPVPTNCVQGTLGNPTLLSELTAEGDTMTARQQMNSEPIGAVRGNGAEVTENDAQENRLQGQGNGLEGDRFKLPSEDDNLRRQALEENRQHLRYGPAPVISSGVPDSAVNCGIGEKQPFPRPPGPSDQVGDIAGNGVGMGSGRPILGAGAITQPTLGSSEDNSTDNRHGVNEPWKNFYMPTERYGVFVPPSGAGTCALPLARQQPIPGGLSQNDATLPDLGPGSFGAIGDGFVAFHRTGQARGGGGNSSGALRGTGAQDGTGGDDGRGGRSSSSVGGSGVVGGVSQGGAGSNSSTGGAAGGGGQGSDDDEGSGDGDALGADGNNGGSGLQMMKKPNMATNRRSLSSGQERGGKFRLSLDKKEDDDEDDDYDEDIGAYNITEEEEAERLPDPDPQPKVFQPERSDKQGFRYRCSTCNQYMNTRESYMSHIKGQRHLYNVSMKKAPQRSLERINKRCKVDSALLATATEITKNCPRMYQLELLEKAMSGDKVIYLPTGTGKTMVAVLTMGLMLKENPSRPVLFLVDKVLLVLQQMKYIMDEFAGTKFLRPNPEKENEYVERELLWKAICGGLATKSEFPIWRHDVIVTTAAFCSNMLSKEQIWWEDFSMVVMDEVHHCNKDHPYMKLMKNYHHKLPEASRPKILGLTASPAGKSSVQQTYDMLQSLLSNLGGAGIAIVERPDSQQMLDKYQSSAQIHPVHVQMTPKEAEFKRCLLEYFIRCYTELALMSPSLRKNTIPCCYFAQFYQRPGNDEMIRSGVENFMRDSEPLSDLLTEINDAECDNPDDRSLFNSLKLHCLGLLINMPEVGMGMEVTDELLQEFSKTELMKEFEDLGLPCEAMKKRVEFFAREGTNDLTMFSKLTQTLQDPLYIDWTNKGNKALVLVRERKRAKQYSHKLKSSTMAQELALRICHLVGHGKGAQDDGMNVKKQKKVLDNKDKYHIFVATSIMEEGVDFSAVQLVVCMNPPTSVRALVQMRGRARKKDSHFVILCSTQEEVDKLELLQIQERNMQEAAKRCLEEEKARNRAQPAV